MPFAGWSVLGKRSHVGLCGRFSKGRNCRYRAKLECCNNEYVTYFHLTQTIPPFPLQIAATTFDWTSWIRTNKEGKLWAQFSGKQKLHIHVMRGSSCVVAPPALTGLKYPSDCSGSAAEFRKSCLVGWIAVEFSPRSKPPRGSVAFNGC